MRQPLSRGSAHTQGDRGMDPGLYGFSYLSPAVHVHLTFLLLFHSGDRELNPDGTRGPSDQNEERYILLWFFFARLE